MEKAAQSPPLHLQFSFSTLPRKKLGTAEKFQASDLSISQVFLPLTYGFPRIDFIVYSAYFVVLGPVFPPKINLPLTVMGD